MHIHRALYAMAHYPSITNQCSIKPGEWIKLVFGTEVILGISYIIL